MKNIIRKVAFILATAAVMMIGTANLYAGPHLPSTQDQDSYQRFLDIGTGGGSE